MSSHIIIHGVKLLSDCNPHPDFISRLDKAIGISREISVDSIVVSGGKTRKQCIAEANFGAVYLQGKTSIPVVIENRSTTTIENIKFIQEKIPAGTIETLYAVIGNVNLFRTKYVYKKLWPDIYPKIVFVTAPSHNILAYLLECIYILYTLIDIREKFLVRIFKKIFRNT